MNMKQDQTKTRDPGPLDPLVRMALSMYLGEECQGCHKTFDPLESLNDSVWWPWEKGRIGHKSCYEQANARGERPPPRGSVERTGYSRIAAQR
jgi:hypothetical protein